MKIFKYIRYIQFALYALALLGLVLIVIDISPAVNIAVICIWALALITMAADHMLELPQRKLEAQLIEEEESQRHSS